jgi:long-chain acyl-CoA synthetase
VSSRAERAAFDVLEAIPSPEPLVNLFFHRADAVPDRVASYSKMDGRWVGTTWREAKLTVEECAYGLLELGADRGTPVGVLSNTRREWALMDMSAIAIGGVTIGIYPTLTGAQSRQILELSGARIVFVDDRAQRVKLEEAAADLEPPLQIITMEARAEGKGEATGRTITLDELRRRGAKRRRERPDELQRRIGEAKSDDVVSYIYTSGTTGEPKGAMLTHANFHYVIHATTAVLPTGGERSLVFLPLAHSLQRYASYLGLIVDAEGYYCESLDKVQEYLREVQPTIFALVPRVLEKIHAKALAAAAERSPIERRIFDRSLSVLHEVGHLRREGGVPGLRQRLMRRAADRLVARRVRERLGGRVKYIGSGGAPLARDTHEFFEDVGIPILEGYGLTETCAPACVNTLQNRRIGTVGRPLPGTEIKIADDGEILIRGPGVFRGYHQNEDATRAAFTDDGWFRSGDIGVMSRDGFLSITDRKKDLIITAGGKNIAPQPLEAELKRNPLVGQAVVIGDGRPYLTALLAIDPEAKRQIADRHGVPMDADAARFFELPAIRAEIDRHLADVNSRHAPFEQIKRFGFLPAEMTVESGELTPTLKVKRRIVSERYRDRIEALYR